MINKTYYFEGSFCGIRLGNIGENIRSSTGKGVKIGVIDSGWDRSLIDCRVRKGIGLVDPEDELLLKVSSDDNDLNGHGTACTEIILRIAPDSSIYPIKVFGKNIETSPNILIEGINRAIKRKLKILSISLGTLRPEVLKPLYKICEIARRKKMILVSAKSNVDISSFPAVFENVIGVESGNIENIFKYEILKNEGIECKAMGEFDNVCTLSGKRIKLSGNSLACAVMTGIIALHLQISPNANLNGIRKLLQKEL